MSRFLEFVPIIVFFFLYKIYDIFIATIGIGITSILTALIEYWKNKKISKFSLINLITLLVMSSTTLILEDASFIKMKPAIIYSAVAIFLIADVVYLKKFYVQKLYRSLIHRELSINTWKKLSIHWIILLLAIAILNEVVWRYIGEDHWVNFKIFIIPVILIAMVITHGIFIIRYSKKF